MNTREKSTSFDDSTTPSKDSSKSPTSDKCDSDNHHDQSGISGSESDTSPDKFKTFSVAGPSTSASTSGESHRERKHSGSSKAASESPDRKRKLEIAEDELKAHKHKKEKQEEERLKMQSVYFHNCIVIIINGTERCSCVT